MWANEYLKEYMIKGFMMDDERLMNPEGRSDYFDELLESIRQIRASEKLFYQKVRDLIMLSSDYDKTDKEICGSPSRKTLFNYAIPSFPIRTFYDHIDANQKVFRVSIRNERNINILNKEKCRHL